MLDAHRCGVRVAQVRVDNDSPAAACVVVMFVPTREGISGGTVELALDQIDDGVLSEVIRACAHLLRDHKSPIGRSKGSGPDEGRLDREVVNLSASVQQAVHCLRENFADPDLTLDAVAKAVYVSRWHLSRIFREQTGRRFVEYLTNLRLERSAALLADTEQPIAEIARQVGYRESSHFHRTFKRWAGTSPSRYRRLRREPVAAEDRTSA